MIKEFDKVLPLIKAKGAISIIPFSNFFNTSEKESISLGNGYPEILEQCYKNNELHPLCFYLRDLSSKFHSFYNAEKIISDDRDYSDAKIALSIAIKEIINNGLNILGIGCPEKM